MTISGAPTRSPAFIQASAIGPVPQGVDFPSEIRRLLRGHTAWMGEVTQVDAQVEDAYAFLRPQAALIDGIGEEKADFNLYNWLLGLAQRHEIYEMNDQHRATLQQIAPPNPISDSPTSQQAVISETQTQVATGLGNGEDPLPTDPEKLAAYDRIGKSQCKTKRGLKTRVTRTHKMQWEDYCQQFQLDPETGLPAEGGVGDSPAATAAPQDSIPTSAPPAGPGAPALNGASAPTAVPPPASPPAGPVAPPPVGPPAPSVPAPAPQAVAPPAAAVPPPVAPPAAPAAPAAPTAPPSAIAPPAPSPGVLGPMATTTPSTQTPATGYGPPPGVAARPPVQPPAPAAPEPAPAAVPTPASSVAPGRAEMVEMLGGPVSLMLVKVKDIGNVNLEGWTDANQLARIAERETVKQFNVEDMADIKTFKKNNQVAERIFNGLLSTHPSVYVIVNGYDWILGSAYEPHLFARIMKILRIEAGGVVETINFS